jgi:N-acetylneuraminic acid mutarotase
MPLALSHVEGSTLIINGKAVLIGGVLTGNDPNITNRVHVYDPVTNTWRTLTTRFPKRVDGATSGYWNGKVYMTDGYSPDESDRSVGFEGTVIFN